MSIERNLEVAKEIATDMELYLELADNEVDEFATRLIIHICADKDDEISRLTAQVAAKDAEIAQLNQELKDKELLCAIRKQNITSLTRQLEEMEQALIDEKDVYACTNKALNAVTAQVAMQAEALKQCVDIMNRLNEALGSWRVSATVLTPPPRQ